MKFYWWNSALVLCLLVPLRGQQPVSFLTLQERPEPLVRHLNHAFVSLPFTYESGLLLIPGQVDGETGFFLFDTGAPMLVVNRPSSGAGDSLKGNSLSSPLDLPLTRVKSLDWRGVRQTDVEALALDLSHLEQFSGKRILGLVGYEQFKQFELLFDFRQNRIHLLPDKGNALHAAVRPSSEVAIELHDHLPLIPLTINGQTFIFGLDSGAGSNILDRQVARSLSINEEGTCTEAVQFLSRDVQLAARVNLEDIALEDTPIASQAFVVMDLSNLQAATGLQIAGILGTPFLKSQKLSIDLPCTTLYLW